MSRKSKEDSKSRAERLQAILRLIREHPISRQEELQTYLNVLLDHVAGLVGLLSVDKDHACHAHGLGALTALSQTLPHHAMPPSSFHSLSFLLRA